VRIHTGARSAASSFLAGVGVSPSLIVAIGAQNAIVLCRGLRREHVGAVVLVCAALDALALASAAFLAFSGVQALRHVVLAQTLAITLLNPNVYLDTVLPVGAMGARQPTALQPLLLLGAGLASAVWFSALGHGARWRRSSRGRALGVHSTGRQR
jgi:L-lysine exporter family protein LysE/ArgO